jgi:aerobic carbon-monoxide dehydrogenase small subunit
MSAENVTVRMHVNGRSLALEVPPQHTLLDVLRDSVRLTGTKECCSEGECGACTVLINGQAVCSCLVLAVEMDDQRITTIEGLASDGQLDPVQQAFVATGAVQCGFCIPGMIMAAHQLLASNPHPSRAEIQEGLAGNLCRCGGYTRIVDAVVRAATDEHWPRINTDEHGSDPGQRIPDHGIKG